MILIGLKDLVAFNHAVNKAFEVDSRPVVVVLEDFFEICTVNEDCRHSLWNHP